MNAIMGQYVKEMQTALTPQGATAVTANRATNSLLLDNVLVRYHVTYGSLRFNSTTFYPMIYYIQYHIVCVRIYLSCGTLNHGSRTSK